MFYEENKIIEIISCSNCQEKLDEPRILPCGETVCSGCISLIQINNNQFECLLCHKQHKMPEEGLPISKKLLALISIQPSEVYRSEAAETLKKKLIDINQNEISLLFGLTNPVDKIKEYCIDLVNKIQIATEETIEQINKFNEKAIAQVKNYENDCIKAYKIENDTREEFNKTITDLKVFHSKWSNYLKQTKINDYQIETAQKEASKLDETAKSKLLYLNYLVFNKSLLGFQKNPKKLENTLLGTLKLESINDMKSAVLNYEQMMQLMKLCEFPTFQIWKLLYRATKDGFGASDFHSKCDNKENTLVIIKSTNGNVFGGYTKQSWSNTYSGNKDDPNAFIFSFKNSKNKLLVMKCTNSKHAIYSDNNSGPAFGFKYDYTNVTPDIFICNNSNKSTESCSNLGNSYKHSEIISGSEEARKFLAGSFKFQTSEIEVYMH